MPRYYHVTDSILPNEALQIGYEAVKVPHEALKVPHEAHQAPHEALQIACAACIGGETATA